MDRHIVVIQFILILAFAEEEKIRCPKGIKKFAFEENPNKYYYCPSQGSFAVLKSCPGGGTYNSMTTRCVGGGSKVEVELVEPRQKKARSRMIGPVEESRPIQGPKLKLEESDSELDSPIKNLAEKDLHNQPSMGRHVTLGALFYGKQNKIANDENFWRVETLNRSKIYEEIGSSSSKIVSTQNTVDRLDAFSLDASLSMSFMGGLISVTGAAKFLNEKRSRDNSVSVSFLYESVTATEYLTQDMRRSLDFPEVCKYVDNPNPPTHVVSSITYGFRGVFDFQKTTKNVTMNQEVGLSLNANLNLGIITAEGGGFLNLTDKTRNELEDVKCKFSGDAILESAPTDFKGALKVYKQFPALAKDSRNVIYFSLSPITKYCGDEYMAVLNEIKPNTIERVREIVTEMENTELMINGMKDLKEAQIHSTTIGQILYQYYLMFKDYESRWKSELGVLYKEFGGYESDELHVQLDKHTIAYENGDFEAKKVKLFLDNRQRELETVRSIIKLKRYMKREELGNGQGNKCRFSNPVTFEYQLRILPDPVETLKCITTDLEPDEEEPKEECKNAETYVDEEIMKAGALYKRFSEFYDINNPKMAHCFLVSMKKMKITNETNQNRNDEHPANIVLLYEGTKENKKFLPPIKPPLPKDITVSHSKVEFTVPYRSQEQFNSQTEETNLLAVFF